MTFDREPDLYNADVADNLAISWLVFAIGGVLFPIVMMLCNLVADKDKKD